MRAEELDAATRALAQTREALDGARSEAKVVQGALADANERAERAQASWREELTSATSGGNAARLEADRTARQLAAAKRVVAHTLEAFGGEMQGMRQAAAESSKQQQGAPAGGNCAQRRALPTRLFGSVHTTSEPTRRYYGSLCVNGSTTC